MNHTDHMNLLHDGIPAQGSVWADLGAGTGAFTLALAELIGPEGTIYSGDRDGHALKEQKRAMQSNYPKTTVHYIEADFTRPLDLPPLDGIVMANSLHFYRHKDPILQRVHSMLKPGGVLLMVEYNTNSGNAWVPYPFNYANWETLAQKNGFSHTRLLSVRPSRFLDGFYSAASTK